MQFTCGFQQLNKTSVPLKSIAQRKQVVRSQYVGGDRDVWIPEGDYAVPDYLDGTNPGDRGFDPFGLSKTPVARSWFANAELYNARWAMLGSSGIIASGIAQKIQGKDDTWWDYLKLYPFPFIQTGNQYTQIVFGAQVLVFIFIEVYRITDWWNPDGRQTSIHGNYPGGLFDPLNFSQTDSDEFRELQEKEIRNGRLAMSSWFAYNWQHFSTGKGPITNLLDHVSNPYKNTIIQNGLHPPTLPDFGPSI